MENNLVKIDPKEFGLEESNVSEIELAFAPKIAEREVLTNVYAELIVSEINEETVKKAKDLRLKLVKVRTGIAEIHKAQKAYFLAAGKFCDAWKNKETKPVEQMEETVSAIEKHFENIEKERISKLNSDRLAEIKQYDVDGTAFGLGTMPDDVWMNFLTGAKLNFEAKKEQERLAEESRLAAIEAEKQRQIEIEKENARLKAEAEAKEKELEKERKKQAEILAESQRLAKIEAEKQAAILAEEIAKAAKLESELKAKTEAEAKEKARQKEESDKLLKEVEEAKNASDKVKLTTWINSIEMLAVELTTDSGNAVAKDVKVKFEGFKKWAKTQIETL